MAGVEELHKVLVGEIEKLFQFDTAVLEFLGSLGLLLGLGQMAIVLHLGRRWI